MPDLIYGARVKEAREKASLGTWQVADRANLSEFTVRKLEQTPSRSIHPQVLERLAKALGVTAEWLAGE